MKSRKNVGSEPGEKAPLGLRIIGGSLRGSKLAYAGDNRVRPMKDRVREALFNLIGPNISGKHVIDLFAGTGALAIEAVSRGAVYATMIELHLPTAKNLRFNVESFNLASKSQIITTDAFYWAKTREKFQSQGPWLVFISPPYDFFVSKKAEMVEMIENLLSAAPKESIMAVESDSRFDFSSISAEISPKKRRSYPPAEIAVILK